MKSQDGDNMFTTIGAAIGTFLGIITLVTNEQLFANMAIVSLILVSLIVLFTYLSIGAFIGLIIDVLIEKIK